MNSAEGFALSVDYYSDESSLSSTSSDAGGSESDSDSPYCPTSDSCESETVVKKGPVLGSISYTLWCCTF